jgi:serine/threonine-protein phosphatase 4 catalytic subunit
LDKLNGNISDTSSSVNNNQLVTLNREAILDNKIKSIDKFIVTLKKCELLKESEVRELCIKAKEVFNEEPNIKYVNSPVSVCGDIHGQFYDLLELFKIGGQCPITNYVFLGDFVDRGFHSVETFLYLIALKVRYKDRICMIRGNHESR